MGREGGGKCPQEATDRASPRNLPLGTLQVLAVRHYNILHSTAPYCCGLHRTLLSWTALQRTVVNYTAPYCLGLHRTVTLWTALHRTVVDYTAPFVGRMVAQLPRLTKLALGSICTRQPQRRMTVKGTRPQTVMTVKGPATSPHTNTRQGLAGRRHPLRGDPTRMTK